MKVVHLCTYDKGGAANAAYRIHRAMLADGIESQMLVQIKTCDDDSIVITRSRCQNIKNWLINRLEYRFARALCPVSRLAMMPSIIPRQGLNALQQLKPDLVHIHWVTSGLLSIEQLGKIKQPIVWTLHDMWPLSPGYQYRLEIQPDCRPFQPLIPPPPYRFLAETIWKRKLKAWASLKMAIVGPSRWMAEEARRSEIFSSCGIYHIPYTLPLDVFKPSVDRKAARAAFNLPEGKKVILFGADGGGAPRKGGDLLGAALISLQSSLAESCLAVFGEFEMPWLQGIETAVVKLGGISDAARLALAYSAADVFVCPSREDNLPNTVLESLACGTPVVAFGIGGLPDMVIPGVTGFLATPFSVEELALGIDQALRKPDEMRLTARQHVETENRPEVVVSAYRSLYEQALKIR